MIIEGLISMFCNVIVGLFSALEVINLPFDMLSTLYSFLAYGTYICGADILLLFGASVMFWWGLNLSIGLLIWLWRLLPLT